MSSLCLVEYQKCFFVKVYENMSEAFFVEHDRAKSFPYIYNQNVLVTNYAHNPYEQYDVLSGSVNVLFFFNV